MMKYIIQVMLPNGESRTYQTSHWKERDGRCLFVDKYDQPKNFPMESCFIEGVDK